LFYSYTIDSWFRAAMMLQSSAAAVPPDWPVIKRNRRFYGGIKGQAGAVGSFPLPALDGLSGGSS